MGFMLDIIAQCSFEWIYDKVEQRFGTLAAWIVTLGLFVLLVMSAFHPYRPFGLCVTPRTAASQQAAQDAKAEAISHLQVLKALGDSKMAYSALARS